jgi:MFS family permease
MADIDVQRAASAAISPPPSPGWIATTFDAFRLPTYRVLWIGTIMAFLAFNTSMTAQNVVAYDLTGNNRAVGAVIFGQGLAMMLLNPFGGAIADRFSKRFLLLLSQFVIGAICLIIAFLLLTDTISILFLTLGAFGVGCMFAFLGPTRTALISDLVPAERVGNGLALIQVGGNFARISGPFLAAALLSVPFIGAAGTYFIIAGIFVFVIATLYRIPPTPIRPRDSRPSVLSDVREGIAYVARRPRLLHTVLSFHVVTILGMGTWVVLPGFAKDVLDAGTAGFGALIGVAALGGLFSSILMAALADSRRAPLYLNLTSVGFGVALMLVGVAPNFPIALGMMVLFGATSTAFQTLNNVIAMRHTEHDYVGRVIGLVFLAWGANALVGLPIGALADVVGERSVLAGAGILLVLIALVLAWWGHLIDRRELTAGKERIV